MAICRSTSSLQTILERLVASFRGAISIEAKGSFDRAWRAETSLYQFESSSESIGTGAPLEQLAFQARGRRPVA